MKPGWRSDRRPRRGTYGFTLIDVLVLIVLLGTVAGSLTVLFSRLAAQSSSTARARQSLALAQSLLAEVRMMPFTYCDPQDARAALATGAFVGGTGCATTVDAMGPEPGETRSNPANRFDGVTDYQGLVMPGPGCPGGVCDISGNLLNGPGTPLAGCSARITMAAQALPGVPALDGNGRPQALRIVATVACPGQADTMVETVRVRHAPRRI